MSNLADAIGNSRTWRVAYYYRRRCLSNDKGVRSIVENLVLAKLFTHMFRKSVSGAVALAQNDLVTSQDVSGSSERLLLPIDNRTIQHFHPIVPE